MKNFDTETIEKLKTLINQIDYEESLYDEEECEGGNYDTIVENLYKVLDIVRGILN